jgi:tRNA(Ile)-lysidine synthase
VDAVLDARLITADPAPVAVAFSGGGDSLALLLAATSWAERHARPILALTVDHRLRPEGADWALWCEGRARRLGVAHRVLIWDGEKPRSGLAAAARRARHRLLAEAAREAGAGVVLLGHTADDRAESCLMRAAGTPITAPRTWSPSPVWPEGRDTFLCRPLLDAGRQPLRASLHAMGETWIEDPANTDPTSLRARTRQSLAAGPPPAPVPVQATPWPTTIDWVRVGPAGDVTLSPEALQEPGAETPGPAPARRLGAALLCAAGADRPPRRAPLERLLAHLQSGQGLAATLAGVRVDSDGARIRLVRDAGDDRRGLPPRVDLPEGVARVWDGRFEFRAQVAGAAAGPVRGRAGRLPAAMRRAILTAPALVRPALPLIDLADGETILPSLAPDRRFPTRILAWPRLCAALGAIVNEAAARRMAKAAHPS